MEGSLLIVLVVALVVVGMTLILAFGYISTEQERAQRPTNRARTGKPAESIVPVEGFFAEPLPAVPIAFVFDDGLVHRLENHVRAEQAVVAQFVRQPSVDNLYRTAGTTQRFN